SPWELRAAKRIWVARSARAGIPVPVGGSLPVCQRNGAKWCWPQIGVNGGGKADGMRVDVAGRDGEPRCNLALNSKLGLLRVRRSKIRLVDENHLQWAKRATIRDVEPKRRQRGRRNASGVSRCRCRAPDQSAVRSRTE